MSQMSANETHKRKILRFLGDKFTESPDELFSDSTIAEDCDIDKTDVKHLCVALEKESSIQGAKRGVDNFYKITIDGLIQLENYLGLEANRAGVDLSQLKKIVKQGLDKIQMKNLEMQMGIVDAGKKHKLRDGLYYVVLIDLAGSTAVSSKMSGVAFTEWIKRFIHITKDTLNIKQRNLSVFIKSVGDGALFLFRNFEDILEWKTQVDEACRHHNETCRTVGKHDFHQYHHKTIIHLSEVYFDMENFDANAFGVNLVFKVEKKFGKDELGITDAVKHVILHEINAGKFKIDNAGNYSVDEIGDTEISLWKLTPIGQGL
jgi:hypothetical protein